MMCQRMGLPPISTMGLGLNSVSSRSLVPLPPQKSITFINALDLLGVGVWRNIPHRLLCELRIFLCFAITLKARCCPAFGWLRRFRAVAPPGFGTQWQGKPGTPVFARPCGKDGEAVRVECPAPAEAARATTNMRRLPAGNKEKSWRFSR